MHHEGWAELHLCEGKRILHPPAEKNNKQEKVGLCREDIWPPFFLQLIRGLAGTPYCRLVYVLQLKDYVGYVW